MDASCPARSGRAGSRSRRCTGSATGRYAPVDAIGIDSWAVDYGLLDSSGALMGNPVSHRDARTDGVRERVVKVVPEPELYATTGLQQLPFNTLYQVLSAPDLLGRAETMLLIPDLLGYWLTGTIGAEQTNASTTQLYDVRRRAWAADLASRVGVPDQILPPLHDPGATIGTLPYISSGTWSLVGVELDVPVLSEAARTADFTNEGGVDQTIRFLRNVSGLWVLSEAMRIWAGQGRNADLTDLLAQAAAVPPLASVIDLEAAEFLPPGDMEARIAAACRYSGQPVPDSQAAVVRCIHDSLALAYRRTVRQAAALSGQAVEVVHVVGGGARNALLCRLTADACGVPVLAGPVEAIALGNALVQARALGVDLPDLTAMRALVRKTHDLTRYEPTAHGVDWDALEARVARVSVRG